MLQILLHETLEVLPRLGNPGTKVFDLLQRLDYEIVDLIDVVIVLGRANDDLVLPKLQS